MSRSPYEQSAYDPSAYQAHMATAAAAYEQAAAMYGGEAHAGLQRHPHHAHHAYAQALSATGLGSAAHDLGGPGMGGKDEGVEMLKSLFPNTRISVKQMQQ